MADKITEDMALDREAKMAVIAGDLIFELLDELNESADQRILGKINDPAKDVSQEESWLAWGEKNAYARLRKRLRSKMKAGVGARERLKPFMNTQQEN